MNNQTNGHSFPEMNGDDETSHFLTDELDHQILMHRDAHFAGDFGVMRAYYMEDNIGLHPEITVERIDYLADIEKERGENLAPLLLSGRDMEHIGQAREAYRRLKEVYESKEQLPRLIADLILTEEIEPTREIDAIIAKESEMVPVLIKIIQSEESFDPLFPGYGYAPYFAILCLGKIQDPKAIIPLFETLGKESVFGEEVILQAFAMIGEPTKRFLLKVVKSRPLTDDNVNAALSLAAFPGDEQVAIAALEQLQDHEVRTKPLLAIYLLCSCDALEKTTFREAFKGLAQDPSFPKELQAEIKRITGKWYNK